jgi:hypothetical protein
MLKPKGNWNKAYAEKSFGDTSSTADLLSIFLKVAIAGNYPRLSTRPKTIEEHKREYQRVLF